MKLTSLFALITCCSFMACTPKNEEVTDEQIEVGTATEVLDTIANTAKDAVKTDENNITPTLPLPQPVFQLLTKRYPNWQEPTYTETVKQATSENEQGPGIVRGDYDGDATQDYALQLQQENSVFIVAVLDQGNGNWKMFELKKDILFNDRGELKSPYLLQLTEAGEKLLDPSTNREITAPHEAIKVTLAGSNNVYLYENGEFKVLSPAE